MKDDSAIFPLHPAQLDVFTDQLLDLASPHYNIGGFIRLKGILNKELFRDVVASGLQTFDAFRMSFDVSMADPVFFLRKKNDLLEISELDFSDKESNEGEAMQWMRMRFNTAFRIKKDEPFYEHYLLKISDDQYWFFGKYHHLILDGYGFLVWVKYLAGRYNAVINGNDHQLSVHDYSAEVALSALYKDSPAYVEDRDYWKNKIPVKPEKIFQRKFDGSARQKSETFTATLSEEQRAMIDAFEEKTKIRLHHLTIAALMIYFGKTSGFSEFIFGIPVHKRGSKNARNVVGMFSGVMPFKGTFKKETQLVDLLKEIVMIQKQDYRHQDYSVGDLVRELRLNSSDGSLFDITINYKLLNFELSFGNELEATIVELSNDYQKNPFQLCWRDFGKQQPLQLQLDFGKDYFSRDEIALLADRIIFIIEQFPNSLFTPVGSIEILPPTEKRLLYTFNNNSPNSHSNKTLVDLFEAQVLKTPDAIALIYGDEELTYKELNERANQLAHLLRDFGVAKESLIPILIERSTEMLVAIIAILKTGGAYVPVDPSYPLERIIYILHDTKARLLLACNKTRDALPSPSDIKIINVDKADLFNAKSIDNLSEKISSSDLAYVIYTSGSTGRPKGVMIEHGSVVSLAKVQSERFQINPEDRILQFSNYCFDASVEQIFIALLSGAALVLFEEGMQLNHERFRELLIQKRITHLHGTPSFLENLRDLNSPTLKRVIAGGDVCKKQLANSWGENVDFYNEYGPTETTVTAIEFIHDKRENTSIIYPIGKPLENVHVYIVNENMKHVPVGVSGEILIGGIQVARGYLNLPELTEEKFIPDQFSDDEGARLYKTGDLARWCPDGNIEFIGRMDEQVKIRGYRIELGEIECILQQCGMVRQAVVEAIEQKDGDKQLVAFVVPEKTFEKKMISAYLKTKLPAYMVPSFFVELEAIPLTGNGKVDRKALSASGNIVQSQEFEAPVTETERKLVKIWEELLDVSPVSVIDNFFEIGGHSLNAMKMVSRLHKFLNVKIEIADIFRNPTVKELAEYLALCKTVKTFSEIERLPQHEYYGLSHAQKRFWILNHYKDASQAYNASEAYTINGNLDKVALTIAILAVIERHEILRTVFVEIEGEPRQKIHSLAELAFEIEEITIGENEDIDSVVAGNRDGELKREYDLATGPLFRVKIFSQNSVTNILLFSIHHIISDGWSKTILMDEVLTLYKSYSNGDNSNLPSLSIQYKDYAAWHSSILKEQESYWDKMLQAPLPVLDFPSDFERPKVLTFLGSSLEANIPSSLTRALKTMATKQNMTLNNLLFSLYGLLVSQYCQQHDIVIGSVTSGRNHVDTENLIGAFINFLPIRFSIEKDSSLTAYLESCNNILVDSFKNQDYPFDLMVERFIERRDFSRNPFFDTMINFHSEIELGKRKQVNTAGDDTGSEIELEPVIFKDEQVYQSVLDFKLDVESTRDQLKIYLSYNARLYTSERMQGFIGKFVELLENAIEDNQMLLDNYDKVGSLKSGLKNIQAIGKDPQNILMPVNICASFVAEPLQEYLEYWNQELGMGITISFSPYGQVFQQLLDSKSALNSNSGLNVLFVRFEDWLREKKDLSQEQQVQFLDEVYLQLSQIIRTVNKHTLAPFLVIIVPVFEPNNYSKQTIARISKLNRNLASLVAGLSRMNLLPIEEITRMYQVTDLYDSKADEVGHMPFTQELYAATGTYLARKIKAFKGPAYKVIVLDCDNTLWKGVCGEVGATNVIIDENYSALQEFVLEKYQEGFLLALCSKNNEEDVWEVFGKHPDMKLKREHIAAHRVNWQPKSNNITAISKELNLGLDSFIFIDDSEFEIEQMELSCPEILSIMVPGDPGEIKDLLLHTWAFDTFHVTEEDLERNARYRVEKERRSEYEKHDSLSTFLESLLIKVTVRKFDDNDFDRAFQLILRTNQFNMNGIRKTQEEILKILSAENSYCRIIEVNDRFGDYGVVGLILASVVSNELIVESFLLSCRVLGRNVENFVISEIQNYCQSNHLRMIRLQFIPTLKNKPFEEFLAQTDWLIDTESQSYSRHISLSDQINI